MQTGTNFSESFTSIYQDELTFLERMVNDYPVSALPLFLLLQNYKKTGNEQYEQLLQKAALYFPNHTWLNYQLSEDESMNSIPEEKIIEVAEEDETDSETEGPELTASEEPEIIPENEMAYTEEMASENSVEEQAILELEKEEMVEFVEGEKADNFEESFVQSEANEKVEPGIQTSFEENIADDKKEEVEEIIENEIPEVVPEKSNPQELTSEDGKEENDISSTEKEINTPDVSDSVIEKIISTEEIPNDTAVTLDVQPEKTEENQPIEFEPLHTVDYFASQGIIIKEEALMNDKLGKQMKSFTDWLKSMKKLHPGKLPEQNEVVEKIIQSSAELSNEDAGVLTEAMADVLIKQGKRGKAIEMFEKLSLMNPSKSIYFAAKIESLKK